MQSVKLRNSEKIYVYPYNLRENLYLKTPSNTLVAAPSKYTFL